MDHGALSDIKEMVVVVIVLLKPIGEITLCEQCMTISSITDQPEDA